MLYKCERQKKRMELFTKQNRALETPIKTMNRLEQDRAYTAKKRASESESEIASRREHNRLSMAKKRALKNPSETKVTHLISTTNCFRNNHTPRVIL